MISPDLLLELTVKSTAIWSAAWIVARLLRRSSAAVRHLIWVSATIGVLVLPCIVLFGPDWNIARVPAQWVRSEIPRPDALLPEVPASIPIPQIEFVESPFRNISSSLTLIDTSLLIELWAIGVVLFMLRLVIGHIRAARITQQATALSRSDWPAIVADASCTLQLKPVVPVLKSHRASVAAACGILRPRVLVPTEAEGWTVQRVRVVLLHELAHIKRRDCLLQTLNRLAVALCWFNPLAHIAASRMSSEQEHASDDLVISSGTSAAHYARELLEMARQFRPGALPEGATLAMARPSQFGERLGSILKEGQKRHSVRHAHYVVATMVLGVCLSAIGSIRLVAGSPEPEVLPTEVQLTSSEQTIQARAPSTPSSSIQTETNLVLVNATPTEQSGRFVSGLSKEDFQVWEDKEGQNIESFSGAAPLSLGLVTSTLSDEVVNELAIILRGRTPEDEYFLAQITTPFSAQLLENFNSDPSRLQKHITKTPGPPRAPVLDTVYLGIEHLGRAAHSRKALLLITDGENNSRYLTNDVRTLAGRRDVQLYVIGIGLSAAARKTMEDLVADNRGTAFFTDSLSGLPDISQKIAGLLEAQYVLGYRPTNQTKDGRWRKVAVKVNPPSTTGPVIVRAKTGYFAPLYKK